MTLKDLLPPYPSSTIIGISVIIGGVCSVLLDQATPKQAAAAVLSGLVAVLLRQNASGTTVVTGPMPVVNADAATIQPAAGSTTTVQSASKLAALLALAVGLSACTAPQLATTRTTLDQVRLFCAVRDSVVALSTATGTPILAQGQTAGYVTAACALAGGVAVSPPGAPVATIALPAVVVPVREVGP